MMDIFGLIFLLLFFMFKIVVTFHVFCANLPDELNSWAYAFFYDWSSRGKSSSNNLSGWHYFFLVLLFIKPNLQQSMIMFIDWLAGLAHIEIIADIAFIPDADNGFYMTDITLYIFVDEVISVDFLLAFDLLLNGLIFDQFILIFSFLLHFNFNNFHFL